MRRKADAAPVHDRSKRSTYDRRNGFTLNTGSHARPRLTFACELDSARLTDLFTDPSVVTHLQARSARVAMMVSDLSSARAAVVQQLNMAGVPVVGIPLVSSVSPPASARRAVACRRLSRATLWANAHPVRGTVVAAAAWLLRAFRRSG